MVKYKVRIVSKTGTVVPELQVLHLIFFFAKPKSRHLNKIWLPIDSYLEVITSVFVIKTMASYYKILKSYKNS